MKLALIGKDVSKSKSKFIHENLIDCEYDLISCDSISDIISSLENGYDGFNVTIPYKESILEYLDEIDSSCLGVLSCNTVVNSGGKFKGYNTDLYGFSKLIESIDVTDKRVLVLGAGGAAKAILQVLHDKRADIYICNRTVQRARQAIDYLQISASIVDISTAIIDSYFAVINTTSVGMWDDENPYMITSCNCPKYAVDIICKNTEFLKTASLHGAHTLSGESMLVYQAALADEIYTGKLVDAQKISKVIKELT